MIKSTQPLDMQESSILLGEIEESEKIKQLKIFIKKFSKIKPNKAIKLREELSNLGFLKLKQEHIAKIIDVLPEDASDLNKIFTETSLSEDEINKILESVKKYK